MQYATAPVATKSNDADERRVGSALSINMYSIIPTAIGEQARNTMTVSTLQRLNACMLVYIAATKAIVYIPYALHATQLNLSISTPPSFRRRTVIVVEII